jgi:signal peptide peptidase SppA
MKLINVITALTTDPWPIEPSAHRRLCEIVEDHRTGLAHGSGGRIEEFERAIATEEQELSDRLSAQAGEQKAQLQGTTGEVVKKPYKQIDNVAVIMMHGVLMKYAGYFEKMSGALDVDDVAQALSSALEDKTVEGILLHINSPGGHVRGVPELAARIREAADRKPMLAFTDDMMASGAYWLAAGADEIYAAPSATVGSIGVYTYFLDVSKQFEMDGVTPELIKRGSHKAAGIEGMSLTEDQRALLQERVDEVYDWFVEYILSNRSDVPMSAMEGQTFYGDGARINKLVDQLGDFGDALEELKSLIVIKKMIEQ